ncbi:hypothetical protein JXA47_17300, partial [Candidatus Sumerlaeota bacterium]|nr:hypothetical protein [Candidatus Sumerlaeota bacterium]
MRSVKRPFDPSSKKDFEICSFDKISDIFEVAVNGLGEFGLRGAQRGGRSGSGSIGRSLRRISKCR